MTPRRFILHGISGLYNYGCEAIVRGTAEILRQAWPDCKVIYLSHRPHEDGVVLSDCDVEVWDNHPPQGWHPKRLAKGALRRCGLPHGWISRDRLDCLQRGDWVLSIGGDIYTLAPPPYPRQVEVEAIDVARRMVSRGCRVVIWGASIGPFDAWPQCIPLYQRFLNDLPLITVREPESQRYLRTLGVCDNVVRVADPAFLLPGSQVQGDMPFAKDGDPIVGLNLSPLATCYVHGKDALHAPLRGQLGFLRWLLDDLGVRVLLVPHVVAPHQVGDDDYRYLKTMIGSLGARYRDRLALLDPRLGAGRTKGVIGQCDALLAARMHCAIAGVSSSVPTLFLAYSSKSWGMCEYVYGSQRWCLDLRDIGGSLAMNRVSELMAQAPRLRRHLTEAASEWRGQALRAGSELANRFGTG